MFLALQFELRTQLHDFALALGYGLLQGRLRFHLRLLQSGCRLNLGKLQRLLLLFLDQLHALGKVAQKLLIAHLPHNRIEVRLLERYDGAAFRALDFSHCMLLVLIPERRILGNCRMGAPKTSQRGENPKMGM